ncbi:chitobiase/beta-hexosaminidase C-terminal domain-containing protein [Geobacter pelophilus]|uniref:Chitobiase/beta-hexosaminidase C-terminal domain-containing protein n=1 Tax=Geoanaerobacter pelophilus TaxID=60036 RepID=A0AAW4L511_9BACT|nr:chitobiase/beta-hexosaminidase C-terminal domain-containing protein [Geoanaerobacter pelophilus]MBT0664625.1 chitobiase/beta-hexosaminidase C-terminal domain-containing protein [Geoanaerobacter pelophilus]
MTQTLRKYCKRMGTTLALFLLVMSLAVGGASAAPIADPDFLATTPIVNPADVQKYVSPLPNAYQLHIAPDTTTFPGEDYYKVDMGQFNHDMKLHLLSTTGYLNTVAPDPGVAAPVVGKMAPTPTWGYSLVPPTATTPGTYYFPGPTIINTQGRPSRVTWTNSLPAKHVVGLDPTLVCGPPTTAGNVNGPTTTTVNKAPNCAPENRVVPHAHGAHVWADSDGDPLAWFSNNFAVTGETWEPNTQHGPVGTYRYINDQEAGTIWYHDHAMGLTHLNVYAGLAGFFLITDANEKSMQAYTPGVTAPVLPSYTATAPYEIPIALQDRKFYPNGTLAAPNNPVLNDTATIGPNVPCDATVGAVVPYACLPAVGGVIPNAILPATTLCDPAAVINAYMCPAAQFSKAADGSLIPYNPTIVDPLLRGPFTAPSITPEFFGNISIANGIVWPKQVAEQRKYRIRLLNGCDSRTYFLKFDNPLVKVWQIGTEQAFLDKPVDRSTQFIILMPGERIDLIVDFAAVPIGTRVTWQNYGPMATVNGLPASPTNPLLDIPYDGVMPLAGQPLNTVIPDVLAFDVVAMNPAVPDATITLTTPLRPVPAFATFPNLTPTPGAPGSTGVPVRKLALIERQGTHGRFMLTLDGRDFMDPNSPITDLPKLNDTEIWEIANFTPDAHPIHVHLVAFQILNRQEFSVDPASPTKIYDPTPGVPPFTRLPLMPYSAPPSYLFVQQIPGDLNYAPLPGGVATVPLPPDPWEIAPKDTIQALPGTVTRLIAKFDLPGLYVWHCHILSHEENDMMRPLIVTTPPSTVTTTLSRNGVAIATSEPAALAAPFTITAQGLTGLLGPAILSPSQSNGFEYQFSVTNPAGVTTVVQPFMAWMYPMLNSYTWTPPKNAPGTYTIRVDARQASATTAGASQAFGTATYTITGPAVAGATSSTLAGTYGIGTPINVTVTFNEPISSPGLTIGLNSGATIATGPLTNVSSFTGTYTVAAGNSATALNVATITGTVTDAAGNSTANPVMPAGFNISNTAPIVIDAIVPVTTASPVAGNYTGPLTVTLTTSKAGATIHYTTDGTIPNATSPVYTAPFILNPAATTTYTVQFFASDAFGNIEPVKSAIYNVHVTDLTNATVSINNNALFTNSTLVTLSLTATDPMGVPSMQVACDGITFGAVEPFALTRACTLTTGDGLKTVAVKYIDAVGTVYNPVTAQITLDTVAPVTTVSPAAGTYNGAINAVLATEAGATIYFTTNGTMPTIDPALRYTAPITISTTSTLKFFAVDQAGNQEVMKSALYTIAASDLTGSVSINGNALFTKNANVTLALTAADPFGVGQYLISNDGVTYQTVTINPAVANFSATIPWVLTPGDGLKTIYVKYVDTPTPNNVYGPFTAQITLDTTPPVTTVSSAAGTYNGAINAVLASEAGATIYFTTNGTMPTIDPALRYTAPITIPTTSTLKFFAVDQAGNQEVMQSALYTIAASDLTGSVSINGNALFTKNAKVTLALTAADPFGVGQYLISNDGVTYQTVTINPAVANFSATIPWVLTPGDGLKTVYVKYVDTPTPNNVYGPFTAQITLDTVPPVLAVTTPAANSIGNTAIITVSGTVTDAGGGTSTLTINGVGSNVGAGGAFSSQVALTSGANTITVVATDPIGNTTTIVRTVTLDTNVPVTTASPAAGNYTGPLTVTLTTSKANATIHYTTDGTTPGPASQSFVGTGWFVINPATTSTVTVKFSATDPAGNVEPLKSVAYSIHVSDLTNATVSINKGAQFSKSQNVTLSLTATDPLGVPNMQVACDGVNFAAIEPFAATRACILPSGDGLKTVAVKYIDGSGNVYAPVTAQIVLDTVAPVTTAAPPAGTYAGSVTVTLTASETATIYYTIDGSVPTTASSIYINPITLSSPTVTSKTLKYFAVDKAGNAEASVNTGVYNLHTSDLIAKVTINKGNTFTNSIYAKLSLSASDPIGVAAYAISTDNITYLPTITIKPAVNIFSASNVPVTLPAGDGLKTVYVRFTDGMGVVYPPVSAQITLETTPVVVEVSPAPGDYSNKVTVSMTTPNEPEGATIYYTTNGATPTTSSKKYSKPFTINEPGTTVTVKYFAVDQAGNVSAVQSAAYNFTANPGMTANVSINNNAPYTNSRNVLLQISAQDPTGGGVATMSFSNDGVNYTTPAPYAATTAMPWTLTAGDSLKTVYFRFTNAGSVSYTFTSKIFLADGVQLATGDTNGDGKVDIVDAFLALRGSLNIKKLTIAEQARCDVAPLVNNMPLPDGKTDSGDVLVIFKKIIGLVSF